MKKLTSTTITANHAITGGSVLDSAAPVTVELTIDRGWGDDGVDDWLGGWGAVEVHTVGAPVPVGEAMVETERELGYLIGWHLTDASQY